ncbi:hypothetical protein [Anaerotignum sp.]
MNAKDVNWAEVKSEYLTTEISLERIADKYGISRSTIKRRSVKEGWVEEKASRKEEVVNEVIQRVVETETEKAVNRLENLQGTANRLGELIRAEIESAWTRREARMKVGALITETDVTILKGLTSTLKNLAEVTSGLYAIPTIKEQIELEKWEREKQQGSGATEGGVIFLPPIMEREEEDDGENDMDTTAEAD